MYVPNQRPAAPWSMGQYWGQFTTAASLPNTAGAQASFQLNDVQPGDTAWVTGEGRLYICTDATVGAAAWDSVSTGGSIAFAQVELVETDGTRTQFNAIQDAIDAASSGDVVMVGPGTYAENLTLKAGVALQGLSGGVVNIVGASPASGTRVTYAGAGPTFVFDIRVQMPNNNDHGFEVTSGVLVGSTIGVLGSSGGSGCGVAISGGQCLLGQVRFSTGVGADIGRGFEVSAGLLNVNGVTFAGGITVNDAIRASGGDAILRQVVIEDGSTITDGIDIGAANVSVATIDFGTEAGASCANAIHLTSNAAEIDIRGARIRATTNDLLVDGGVTSPRFLLEGSLQESRISATPGFFTAEDVVFEFRDDTTDDEAKKIYAELHVGSAERGRESSLGQGDDYARGMVVLQATGATAGTDGANFVDVSAEAQSPSGSTFGFASGAVGDVLYSASSLEGASGMLQHFGHRVKQTVAMVGGAVILEVWNGATWAEIHPFETLALPPFTPRNGDIWRTTDTTHIRFGVLTSNMLGVTGTVLVPTTWVAKTVNGMGPYFWMRYRITSAPGTPPVFEQWKLHPSRTEINSTGFLEWYGEARRRQQLMVHQRLTDDLGGASPGNVAIQIASGLTITPVDNNFTASADDGFGLIFQAPFGLDPSLPLLLRLGFRPSNSNAGNIVFETELRSFTEGDTLDAAQPLTSTITETVAAPGVEDRFSFYEVALSIDGIIPGQGYVAFGISRLGSDGADTFTGNVEVVSLQLFGFVWTI